MTDYEITDAMIVYGGGFVRGLAHLFTLADPQNQERLKNAFPDYWQQYADLARRAVARQTGEAQSDGNTSD